MTDAKPTRIEIAGNNYGNVAGRDINLAPEPAIRDLRVIAKNEPGTNGACRNVFAFDVRAPNQVKTLRVTAVGTTITGIQVMPTTGGAFSTAADGMLTPERAVETILGPLGQVEYTVVVWTEQAENLDLWVGGSTFQ